MAKVFLSYDREDLGKAKTIAAFLEDAGHSVWWDRHIRGGAQYSKEIERALEESDAVVVLWSSASINSEWVRDEAAEGRDRGALIPAIIEAVKPPMGFRQFQTIDLTDWNASPSKHAHLLLDSMGQTSRPKAYGDAPRPARRTPFRPGPALRPWLKGLGLLLILTATGLWWLTVAPASVPTVSVAPADNNALSQSLARNLLIKLGVLQGSSNAHAIKIVDAAGEKADLNFTVNGLHESGKVRASVALVSSADQAILWSQDYDRPDMSQSDLEAQIAFSAARVLDCASEEASGKSGRLSDSARRTFLNACAMLAELGWDKSRVIPMLRTVIEEAPKFRPAWAKLLFAETDVISFLISGGQPVDKFLDQLRKDVVAARKSYPDLAEATLAELELGDRDSIARSVRLVDKANSQDPDNATVLSTRSTILQSTGRMADAISDAQRASELDPLSPANRNAYILALAYGGQIGRAREELDKAKKLWPGAKTVLDAEYSLELRFGDFVRAVRAGEEYGPGSELYLKARSDPSDDNVSAFINHFLRSGDRELSSGFVLQALGEMNRVDEFFDYAEQTRADRSLGFHSYVLFRPWVAPARHDPRFIRLAKGIGLVDYWQKSGIWPDFCRQPHLPYDCKAEAAKLS